MASVHAVADYILGKIAADDDRSITSPKLQKLVYYCHARNLARYGEPLCDEQVRPWIQGPTVWSLHLRFKDYGDLAIDPSDVATDAMAGLSSRDRVLIDEVWEACGSLSDAQLRNLHHQEALWRA